VVVLFPRYLQYLLTDFRQTFVTGASWDTDDLITFLGQKAKVQGHTIAAETHSTRRYRQVQLFLVVNVLFYMQPRSYASIAIIVKDIFAYVSRKPGWIRTKLGRGMGNGERVIL